MEGCAAAWARAGRGAGRRCAQRRPPFTPEGCQRGQLVVCGLVAQVHQDAGQACGASSGGWVSGSVEREQAAAHPAGPRRAWSSGTASAKPQARLRQQAVGGKAAGWHGASARKDPLPAAGPPTCHRGQACHRRRHAASLRRVGYAVDHPHHRQPVLQPQLAFAGRQVGGWQRRTGAARVSTTVAARCGPVVLAGLHKAGGAVHTQRHTPARPPCNHLRPPRQEAGSSGLAAAAAMAAPVTPHSRTCMAPGGVPSADCGSPLTLSSPRCTSSGVSDSSQRPTWRHSAQLAQGTALPSDMVIDVEMELPQVHQQARRKEPSRPSQQVYSPLLYSCCFTASDQKKIQEV